MNAADPMDCAGAACCRRCEDAALAGLDGLARMVARRFIVSLDCTGSNATGQKGSDY